VGATAAALVDLSTVAGNKISNPPWVKFQSAGWVNFPSAPTAGVSIAINDLRELINEAMKKTESEVFGAEGSRADLFYKLKKSESEIKRLTILIEKLSGDLQRISSLHRGELNDREDKTQGLLAAAHQSGRNWSVTCLLIGLLFGGVFGSGYLAPKFQAWAAELIYKPIHQGR